MTLDSHPHIRLPVRSRHDHLVLQLRFSLTAVVSSGGFGLVSSSPVRPGPNKAGSDWGPEQETRQKIADLGHRRQKRCKAHQAAAGTAGAHSLGLAQCCSLCDLDGSGEVDAGRWLWGARSQRVVAHLALDPAWHLPTPAALRALLQNFVQHRLMQEALGPRGKGPRTAATCAGPRARHVGTTAGPDPRRPAAPPRASAPARPREHANPWGAGSRSREASGSRKEGGLVPKLVWRVKLVAELEPGVTTETEVACLERGEEAGLADLGLRLDEAKQLTAALQAQMVSAQVAVVGERCRSCAACGRVLASKGYYRATFRSLFGDVPVRVRRLLVCPCHGPGEPKSFAALDLGAGTVAPELAYVTAKFAALAPFGKVAALLSELLPLAGARNAGTVRNRTLRVGQDVVQQPSTGTAKRPMAQPAGPVVVGLDGGYVRSRHRPERHFEVIAGKVIDARGAQHRFAFARNGPATASEAFRQALVAAGVGADTPATVLCDGDAGLWRVPRGGPPGGPIGVGWWGAPVRFGHTPAGAPRPRGGHGV